MPLLRQASISFLPTKADTAMIGTSETFLSSFNYLIFFVAYRLK